MYSAPEDENGFGPHFGTPNIMIRPCADIRRDSRRASRALSSLIASQEEPLVLQSLPVQEEQENDMATPNPNMINPQYIGSSDIHDPEINRRNVQYMPYKLSGEEAIYQAPSLVGYHPMSQQQLHRIASFRQSMDMHSPRGSRDLGAPSSDGGSECSNLGSRTSMMPIYVPNIGQESGVQMVQMISPTMYCVPRKSDQILRFPDNQIATVEISNKDAGTVVRFELSSKYSKYFYYYVLIYTINI